MNQLIIKRETRQVKFQHGFMPESDLIACNHDILVVKVPGHHKKGRRVHAEYQVFFVESAMSDSQAIQITASAYKLLAFPTRQNAESEVIADTALKNLFNLVTLSSEKGEPSESPVHYETDSDDPMFLKE